MEGFVFYRSFFSAVERLPENKRAQAFEAICAAGLDGQMPDDDAPAEIKMLVDLIIPQLKANEKRRVSGAKGGRPKKTEETDKVKPMRPRPMERPYNKDIVDAIVMADARRADEC